MIRVVTYGLSAYRPPLTLSNIAWGVWTPLYLLREYRRSGTRREEAWYPHHYTEDRVMTLLYVPAFMAMDVLNLLCWAFSMVCYGVAWVLPIPALKLSALMGRKRRDERWKIETSDSEGVWL